MVPEIFKVALIGCGVIAPNHLTALAENPTTEVIALCDLLPEKAEAMRDRYAPDAAVYTEGADAADVVPYKLAYLVAREHCRFFVKERLEL